MLILFLGATLTIMLIGVILVETILDRSLQTTPIATLLMIEECLVMKNSYK